MNPRSLFADRLEFFIDDKAVGFFVDRHYPARPGRYRYDPYRGEGRALMVSLLDKGEVAKCRFICGKIEFSITIKQEIFVPATPESYWFIDIIEVDPVIEASVATIAPGKEKNPAISPVRMRGSSS